MCDNHTLKTLRRQNKTSILFTHLLCGCMANFMMYHIISRSVCVCVGTYENTHCVSSESLLSVGNFNSTVKVM